MSPLHVLLVTSWNTPCGIADHAAMLTASVEAADPTIEVQPHSEALDPAVLLRQLPDLIHLNLHDKPTALLVHLNHHDGLHSRWTTDYIVEIRRQGIPVVVTYHDTRAQLLDCPKLAALGVVASAVVVHEPVEGLRGEGVHYWRQGVPAAARRPAQYTATNGEWIDGCGQHWLSQYAPFKAFPQQPVLGTVGFNFPWKNYDRLAQLTGEEGWALVLLSNNATAEDEARWRSFNPSILVVREFLTQPEVVNYLAGCDATAFMYECANTGTSGAIRQGIAARKPVIALETCRQFRDLFADEFGSRAIDWVLDWGEARTALRCTHGGHVCTSMHALAEQDSWVKLGAKYATLYRALVEG